MTHALTEEQRAKWNETIPLRRGGSPDEVAKVTLFLASDLSVMLADKYPCLRWNEYLIRHSTDMYKKAFQEFGALFVLIMLLNNRLLWSFLKRKNSIFVSLF